MALPATAMRISKRVWQQHVRTPMALGICLRCQWEPEELCWQMGWVGTILIIFCRTLTSSNTSDTVVVVLSLESFHAGKIINKDSHVKLLYMKEGSAANNIKIKP